MDIDDPNFEIDAHLPAIVIGHRVDEAGASALRAANDPAPWLVWWQHQHGGLACDQVELAGALLPLRAAPESPSHALRDEVLRGIEALACGAPYDREIRQHREVAPLHLTFGHAYDEPQLQLLGAFLARGFRLPGVERAHEAFVELAECDLHGYFDRWPVLAREIPERSHLADPDAHQVVMGPRTIHRARCIDARLLNAIAACHDSLGLLGPPRAFLVWTNSD